MARVRPTAGLNNLGRQSHPNNYVTLCKVCGHGIFRGQPYRWLSDPMGLSHDVCAEQREASK